MKKMLFLIVMTLISFSTYAHHYMICLPGAGNCFIIESSVDDLCNRRVFVPGINCGQLDRTINKSEKEQSIATLKKLVVKSDAKTGNTLFYLEGKLVIEVPKKETALAKELTQQVDLAKKGKLVYK